MHRKKGSALNYIVFVILMGPLIWLSQTMHWGDAGTLICVIVGFLSGWLLLLNGKFISKRIGRTFRLGGKQATADFLFSPSGHRHQQQMVQYRKLAQQNVGTRNVPIMSQRSVIVDSDAGRRSHVQVTPIPNPTANSLQVPNYSPDEALQHKAIRRAASGGPLLHLGQGADIYLATTLTSAMIIDTQTRRLASSVFIEEWMRLGLGLLIVDVYGDYVDYLAPRLSEGFGFLAGSSSWQGGLSALQQSRYMDLESTQEAISVGESIANEGLQVVLNIASYPDAVDAGTYLLAILSGIEHKAREIPSKPCAILVTDARPLLPENDLDCWLTTNMGVAQNVFDILVNMLKHAGRPALRNLAVFLTVPTPIGVSDEVLAACRLWIVNSTDAVIIDDMSRYLNLEPEEAEQLQDGDVMLYDSEGKASFARFRRTTLQTKKRPLLPSEAASDNDDSPQDDALMGER